MSIFMAATGSISINLNLRVVLQNALRDTKFVIYRVDGKYGLCLRAKVLDQTRSVQVIVTSAAVLLSVLYDGEYVFNRPWHDSPLLTSLAV